MNTDLLVKLLEKATPIGTCRVCGKEVTKGQCHSFTFGGMRHIFWDDCCPGWNLR